MQTPVIDTNEIIIEAEDLPSFDSRLQITMPSSCIKKISARLIEGGMQQTDDQLVQILLKVCVDEVFARQDRPSVWSPSFTGGKPVLPEGDGDFCFEMMIDQIPDFDVPPFSDFTIRRPQLQISEDLIQQELHLQCLESGSHEATDAPISVDYRVTIDIEIFSDDTERDPISLNGLVGRVPHAGQPIVLNGLKFNDLTQALLAHTTGDVFEAEISLPHVIQTDGFSAERHRTIITIHKIEVSNPLSVDEVIKMYGTPNIVVLKSQIQTSLQRRFELDQIAFMTEDFFRQLLEQVEYSPPERILKLRELEVAQNAFKACRTNGGSEEEAKLAAEKAVSSTKRSISQSLKRQAIAAVLSSKNEVQLSEEEVQDQIRNLAALQGKRPEDFRQELIDSGKIHAVTTQVLEHQLTRLALAEADVVDIDPQ